MSLGVGKFQLGAVLVGSLLISNVSTATESLDQLSTRMGIGAMGKAIAEAKQDGFASLPALRYSQGVSGFLKTNKLYPNPRHSFVTCDEDLIDARSGPAAGCVVSLRLARKAPNGEFLDTGIRLEYGVIPGGKVFKANNSGPADNLVEGTGVIEAQLR